MERFPEMEQLGDSAGRRVDAAADEAVVRGGLDLLDAVLAAVSSFASDSTLARRALLRTLLREHFEALQKTGGPLPAIADYLATFPDAEEQAVVREVFAEQLPTLRVELGREIGRGGMGVIYEARQTAVGGRRVAVKMLDVGLANQAALWNRLREEVDILAQIPSTNVVQVFDVGLINGQLAVVMELAEQSLQERTGGLPQDQREAAQTVRKLAVAVQKAHDHPRNLIHQDLKPSNVLVMPDGEYKVTDFGLSRSAKANDTPTAARIVGTPGWLAPEQARGEPPTFATDVWGLGTVLYYLLTGAGPFPPKRDQINAVLTELLFDAATRRNGAGGDRLDPKLDAIVTKCLQKDPMRRYRRPIELAQDLQRYLNAEPVEATAIPRAKRSAVARFGIPTILAIACLAAAIPITKWAMSSGDNANYPRQANGDAPPVTQEAEQCNSPETQLVHNLESQSAEPQPAARAIEEAATKPGDTKGAEPPPKTDTAAKHADSDRPDVSKPPAKPAVPVNVENHFFVRDLAKGASDCEFDLPIDAYALTLMPDDIRKAVEADPSAKVHETWNFAAATGKNNERRTTFTRTLKVRYNDGGAPREVTLETRFGECSDDNASRFFKPGKHYFINEASFGSLKNQQKTLSSGPNDPGRSGKLLWKGASKNYYELSGPTNDDLIIWGLIPKRD